MVPYRDRKAHLDEFVPHMQKFLPENGAKDFRIVVVEQAPGLPFNKGKLLNAGFEHTKRAYDHYVFHDIDLLPLEADYSPCAVPTHLSPYVEQFDWKLPYKDLFGGVVMFPRDAYVKLNGYNNGYWGWGAEDDDMFRRCRFWSVRTDRRGGRYRSLAHARGIDRNYYNKNIERLENFTRSLDDGLKNVNYQVLTSISTENYDLVKFEI